MNIKPIPRCLTPYKALMSSIIDTSEPIPYENITFSRWKEPKISPVELDLECKKFWQKTCGAYQLSLMMRELK